MSESIQFCSTCGRRRESDHSFCPGCGRSYVALEVYQPRPLSPHVASPPPAPIRRSGRRGFLAGVVVLAILSVGGTLQAQSAGPPDRIAGTLDRDGLDPFGALGRAFPSPTFTPTATSTPTATPTMTPTPTATPTPRPTDTPVPAPFGDVSTGPQSIGPFRIDGGQTTQVNLGSVSAGQALRIVLSIQYNNRVSSLFGTASLDASMGGIVWNQITNGAALDWRAPTSGPAVLTVSNARSNVTAKVVTVTVYR